MNPGFLGLSSQDRAENAVLLAPGQLPGSGTLKTQESGDIELYSWIKIRNGAVV
jgi:hypothetical protein